MNTLNQLLTLAIYAAETASQAILDVYNTANFQVEAKGDASPLTLADKKAHQVIASILQEASLPLLSEEGRAIPYSERQNWSRFWMVDPLDGTKEFIKRNGEFTVNIALIQDQKPVMGVVAVPVTGQIYYASKGQGAFVRSGSVDRKLPVAKPLNHQQPGIRVVASRSHMSDETLRYIETLNQPVLVSKGSSLKFMLLAEGQADIYPRFAPTMEWDTAAAHAVANEAGFLVSERETRQELLYNKADLLNPHFVCQPCLSE